MIPFEQEPAFVLHRKFYKENSYLVDIFSLNHGIFRACARITQKKTHRQTNDYATFRLLHISGQQKGELASLWRAEVQHDFTPKPALLFNAHYLNELLLGLLPLGDAAPVLFQQYLRVLPQADASALRQFEYALLAHLGLIPALAGEAPFYQFDFSGDTAALLPAASGYARENLVALLYGAPNWQHPETRQLLQTLVRFYSGRHLAGRTRQTTLALRHILLNAQTAPQAST